MTQLRRPRFFAHTAVLAALVLASATAAFGLGSVATPHAQAQALEEAGCIKAPIESGDTDDDALSARIIVDSGQTRVISGDVNATFNGTTCGIGVYVAPGAHATITHAAIHDAQAFGVYNNGGEVTITNSKVQNILGNGESCGGEDETDDGCGGSGGSMGGGDDKGYTGGRHGTGILFVGAGARGTITSSTIENYGRRGISVSGRGAFAHIVNNQIIAPTDPLSWLNGVWIANGARAIIADNHIADNRSPDPVGKSSSAIMIAGGNYHNGMPNPTIGIQISGNDLTGNDTGVLLSNMSQDSAGKKYAPDRPTLNFVTGNTISTIYAVANNDAGIKDAGGNKDHITGNVITGYSGWSIVTTSQCINLVEAGNTIQ